MAKAALRIGYLMQTDASDMSQVSGPQLHIKAVVQGLQRHGHQVRMVAIQRGQILQTDDLDHWQPAWLLGSNSRPFRAMESVLRGAQSRLDLPFLGLFDSYRFSDACVSALRGYDILYERYGMLSYGGLIAARRLKIPLVMEVNGDLVEEYHQLGIQLSKAQWAAVNLLTRQTFEHATRIIAVGETIKRRLVDRWHLDAGKVSVVTNGADVDLFAQAASSLPIRQKYSLDGQPVIIFVGSFQPWHGVDLLVTAFADVAAHNPAARLVLVGDGGLRPDMERTVNALALNERVVFTGKVPHEEVAALLSTSDIAVLCHRGSAAEIVETPLKLFEYMASGKAIVAPKVPNMERVLSDHVTALLVPPDNPGGLAAALNEFLEDKELRCKLGQAARQQALTRHSWDRAVSELESVMYGLLDRPGS